MRTPMDKSSEGITLTSCQNCDQLKVRIYLCKRGHSTCCECQELSKESIRRMTRKLELLKNRSPPICDRLSPYPPEASSPIPVRRPCRPPDHRPPTIASRSPAVSLRQRPGGSRVRSIAGDLQPPVIPCAYRSDMSQIFCRACGDYVEVALVSLPKGILGLLPRGSEDVGGEEDTGVVDDGGSDETASVDSMMSESPLDERDIKEEVDKLRVGLATACSELLTARGNLDEIIHTTEKLGMDVDMLLCGVSFLYVNFDSILKREEVRIGERICGIPFVIMLRIRPVSQVPCLGFFIGLDPAEGLAHSPLKKIIVLRAHNAYGKVLARHTLKTFEKGVCVHPCFDRSKQPPETSLWGFKDFLKKDRILKPDVLKNGSVCLSLQIKTLPLKAREHGVG